jgi:hypothetical protein
MISKIPYSGGVEYRLIGGAISAGIVRTIIECPFEYAKVKK